MSVVGEVASVIGIIAPALHATRLLLNDINNIRDAPEALGSLKHELEFLENAVAALKALPSKEFDELGQEVLKEFDSALTLCTETCDKFRADLGKWVKPTDDGKLSWHEKVKVGFFKQQRINSLASQLQNWKVTINMVTSVATLHSSIRNRHDTENIEKSIAAQEVMIKQSITTILDTKSRLNDERANLPLQRPSQDTSEDPDDETQASEEIGRETKCFDSSQTTMEKMLAHTESVTGVRITNIRADGTGKVLAGLINSKGKYSKVGIVVDNVQATAGGKVITGVVEDVKIDF